MNVMAAFQSAWSAFWDRRSWTSCGGRTTTAQEFVDEDSALNYSAVWAATRLLCGTGASLPFPLYRGLMDETREKAREHAVFRLLNGMPNPEMTAYAFRSVMWQWQVNCGNGYSEIVREGGNRDAPVAELWPIHPSLVTPKRDGEGTLYYEVRDQSGSHPYPMESWQMLHIPSILTTDGIIGMGVIEHARESIGAGIAAEKRGASEFGSGAMPRVVIEIPGGDWSPDKREAFRKEWDEIHSGSDGRRVALLLGGAKANALSLSAQDSQYIETRQFGVEEIARWYGVPPHLLQHLLRATFNNIEHLGISFVQYSLIPWLRIWEQCVWKQLLTESEREEYFAEHNVDGLLRGDFATRMSGYVQAVSNGLATRNECRRKENWDPVDGGDTFLVQGAMVPLDDDGRPISKFTDGATAQPQPASMPEPEDDDTEDAAEAVQFEAALIADSVHQVIYRDLSRYLTKETRAIEQFARKPTEFLTKLDTFYDQHAAIVRGELTQTFGTLQAIGVAADAETFVAEWLNKGKMAVVDASGTATPEQLSSVIHAVFESKEWSERPNRAVEGLKNATIGV